MRFKLGLLQDTAAIEKQTAREAAEAQAKKHKLEAPTVKTEAQTKAEEAAAAKDKEKGKEKVKEPPKPKPKIRPLSEAKAIDSGANFVSETFLLLVGVALILGENWRQTRKAANRREDIAERLAELEEYEKSARRGMVELEREILRLRAKEGKDATSHPRILPQQVWELEEKEEAEEAPKEQGWWSWIKSSTLGTEKASAPQPESRPESPPQQPEEENKPAEVPKHNSSILDQIRPSRTIFGHTDMTARVEGQTTTDAASSKKPHN